MFSSPHSHDAMRRLLKAAVGVPEKMDPMVAKSDTTAIRRAVTHRADSDGQKNLSDFDPRDHRLN